MSSFKTSLNAAHDLSDTNSWENKDAVIHTHQKGTHFQNIKVEGTYYRVTELLIESQNYNIVLGPCQSTFSLLCQLMLKKHYGGFSNAI